MVLSNEGECSEVKLVNLFNATVSIRHKKGDSAWALGILFLFSHFVLRILMN